MDLLYRLIKVFTFEAPLTGALTLCHKRGPCSKAWYFGNIQRQEYLLHIVNASVFLIRTLQFN